MSSAVSNLRVGAGLCTGSRDVGKEGEDSC